MLNMVLILNVVFIAAHVLLTERDSYSDGRPVDFMGDPVKPSGALEGIFCIAEFIFEECILAEKYIEISRRNKNVLPYKEGVSEAIAICLILARSWRNCNK